MDKVTFAGARALCGFKPGLPGDTNGGCSMYCPSPPPLSRSLAPGPRGEMVPGWQNHPRSWSDRDSIVTLCSLCCLWKGCSNPISSAFHGCQLSAGMGRPVSEIGAIVRSIPQHVLIHPSCCPGPLCWLASPLPVASPHLPAAPPSFLF